MGNLKNDIDALLTELNSKKEQKVKMVIGVDGFVDAIIHAVDQRMSVSEYTTIKTLGEFGNRISKAAGLSTNIELVVDKTKLGGNGPIMANALIEYGTELTYIGCVGNPDIHPVFKPMASRCTVYSTSDPGTTDALEFEDGKLMLGKHEALKDITWQKVKDTVGGVEKLAELINSSDLFGMENWTMITYMSQIWEGIIEEVFPLLNERAQKPLVFFDLADPEKRTKADILHALNLISKFEQKFRVILGLNQKEVLEIAEVFDIPAEAGADTYELLKQVTEKVYDKLKVYTLVVHPTKEACACCNGEFVHTVGPYTDKPKLTTGAGDNFNAGFCFGQSLGLNAQLSVVLGVATSGFYVRNAKSPTLDDVIGFLNEWKLQ